MSTHEHRMWFWIIWALAVAFLVGWAFTSSYLVSIIAERNDYLELIRVYGLGCIP